LAPHAALATRERVGGALNRKGPSGCVIDVLINLIGPRSQRRFGKNRPLKK